MNFTMGMRRYDSGGCSLRTAKLIACFLDCLFAALLQSLFDSSLANFVDVKRETSIFHILNLYIFILLLALHDKRKKHGRKHEMTA